MRTQYAVKYEAGNEIVSTVGNPVSEVRDRNGNVKYRGRTIKCVRWLAERGDRRARHELSARKDK